MRPADLLFRPCLWNEVRLIWESADRLVEVSAPKAAFGSFFQGRLFEAPDCSSAVRKPKRFDGSTLPCAFGLPPVFLEDVFDPSSLFFRRGLRSRSRTGPPRFGQMAARRAWRPARDFLLPWSGRRPFFRRRRNFLRGPRRPPAPPQKFLLDECVLVRGCPPRLYGPYKSPGRRQKRGGAAPDRQVLSTFPRDTRSLYRPPPGAGCVPARDGRRKSLWPNDQLRRGSVRSLAGCLPKECRWPLWSHPMRVLFRCFSHDWLGAVGARPRLGLNFRSPFGRREAPGSA